MLLPQRGELMSKGKGKKVNPRRKPASQQDVKRAKLEAEDTATLKAVLVLFSALLDKGYLDPNPDTVAGAWAAVEYRLDSLASGRCTMKEIEKTMWDDYNIRIN